MIRSSKIREQRELRTMRYYVSIAGVSDDFLEFLGYVAVPDAETDELKAYRRHGELMIVKKANPFLYVDDLNDKRILKGRNIMTIPADDEVG
jgi:hypothetical protein